MARDFDGTNDKLQIDSAVLTAAPITMACWYNVDNLTSDHELMSLADKDAANDWFILEVRASSSADKLAAGILAVGGYSQELSAAPVVAGAWEHGCAVFASSIDRRVFRNGVKSSGSDVTLRVPLGIDRTSIGTQGSASGSQNWLNGKLAEAAIWDVALTDAEVSVLATGVPPIHVRPGSLRAYWPIWGTGSPEPDYTNGDRALTVTEAVQYSPHQKVGPLFGDFMNAFSAVVAASVRHYDLTTLGAG